jgi:hypothetical protein
MRHRERFVPKSELMESKPMWCLYGIKPGQAETMVATFDSEAQLRAYVQWATLSVQQDGTRAFEQKTPLTGYKSFTYHEHPDLSSDESDLPHNPSPSML